MADETEDELLERASAARREIEDVREEARRELGEEPEPDEDDED
jgi:hypothetical protein